MSDSASAAIIIPIATVLFGGVVSALVTQTLTMFRADTERRLQKLEDLYSAVQDAFIWGKQFQDLHIALHTGAKAADELSEVKSLRDQIDKEHCGAYGRLMVLCDVWFPGMKQSAQELVNSISAMSHFVEASHRHWLQIKDDPIGEYKSPPSPEGKIFYWRDVLSRQIIEEAQSIRRGRILTWVRNAIDH